MKRLTARALRRRRRRHVLAASKQATAGTDPEPQARPPAGRGGGAPDAGQPVQDQRLLPPVRAQVKELEPVLLRLSQSDPRFFSDRKHPARQLLDSSPTAAWRYRPRTTRVSALSRMVWSAVLSWLAARAMRTLRPLSCACWKRAGSGRAGAAPARRGSCTRPDARRAAQSAGAAAGGRLRGAHGRQAGSRLRGRLPVRPLGPGGGRIAAEVPMARATPAATWRWSTT